MAKPVHIIGFAFHEQATLGRHWSVVIDKKDFAQWVEEAAGPWREKAKALLNLEELAKTPLTPGTYELLICANCASSGYRSCDDLKIGSFQVEHDGDFILWNVRQLTFRFHRPQYERALSTVRPA